ncbi:Rossmann-fold NAD(P)-binding domain-containing protein [Rhizobium leguminosarum]|uniref:hypothetical protein n=1 Tax=Rhizobium leguminosarum TaxID=384 RepID=UPI003D083CCA
MTTQKKHVVGITDHMFGAPDLEAEVLGDDVEIDFFATIDETLFSPERLARLDALMVWGARLGPKSIAHLSRCRGVVRYGGHPPQSRFGRALIIGWPTSSRMIGVLKGIERKFGPSRVRL